MIRSKHPWGYARKGPKVPYGRAMQIRDLAADDVPAVVAIFATVVADGETYAYPDGLDPPTIERLWVEPPPWRTLVAIDGGEVVGTAKFGPNRPGRGAHVATASFMVDPSCAGRGIGRALGERVLSEAAAAGYRAMQFNAVVETNVAAVRLWQSLGFGILATAPEAFDSRRHGLVGLHIMHRRL